MSGITGVIDQRQGPVAPALLKRMTDAIAHRGPDVEGCYIDRFVGLGHRNSSVCNDSIAGDQPMIDATGRFIIVLCGTIYNDHELRAQLQALGHVFRSRTDTEVVLHAFMEWGEDSVEKFNGMFALALWDNREERLFLARDRYGIKPIYYAFFRGVFLFGSEQKALLAHPAASKDMDLEALFEYFTFQNIFTEKTFLDGIRIFPAGCSCFVDARTEKLVPRRYWDYDFKEPGMIASEDEYAEELDRLFRQAVGRQLAGKAEIGAYLSGGMDSGSIVAIAAPQLPGLKTFTCGFDLHSASGLELAFDERSTAEYMSYLFKTEHYEMILKAGDMERAMEQVAFHIEEPRVGQSYPNYYAAQLASKFVKVVLAGSGGDELFGGYPWRYYRATNCVNFNDYVDKYYSYWQRLLPNNALQELFAPVWTKVSHVSTRDIFEGIFPKSHRELKTPEDCVNNSLYMEAKTFLHGLLVVDDKLSAAHGLETRLPFLDNDLVDFAMRLPVSYKIRHLKESARIDENDSVKKNLFLKSNDGKQLLRKVMGRYVPASVTEAEKQGFSAPDASWFKGESCDYVRRVLYDKHARLYNYLDFRTVTSLINEHLDGRQNRRLLIWSLLSFEKWLHGVNL